jgi:hypothetical protein
MLLRNMHLKIHFNSLFDICENQNALVQEVWDGNDWCLSFRRSLYGNLVQEWETLIELLGEVRFDVSREDEVIWAIDKSQVFTTKSLYYAMSHGGLRDHLNNLISKSKIPS